MQYYASYRSTMEKLSEQMARQILQDNRVERGMDDSRTAVEIVAARELMPQADIDESEIALRSLSS